MKPLKAKLSERIMKLVKLVPWIFSKRFNTRANDYLFHNDKLKQETFSSASLFEGDFTWKGIAITLRLNHEELERAHNWIKGNMSVMDYSPERDAAAFSTKFGQGMSNRSLGWFGFNNEHIGQSFGKIDRPNTRCKSCFISLDKLSNGFNYLTMYFFLTKDATNSICNTNVKKVESYDTLQSLNPFSKRFNVTEIHGIENVIIDHIKDNFNEVLKDATSNAKHILKLWSINKSDNDLTIVSDIYRDSDKNYFGDLVKSEVSIEKNKQEKHYFVNKYRFFHDIEISDNRLENFCVVRREDNIFTDHLYIHSQLKDSFKENRSYLKSGSSPHQSHLFLSLLTDCNKQLGKILDYANTALLENDNKPEFNHNILHRSTLKLDSLEENVLAIEDYLNFACLNEYKQKANLIIANLHNIINNLKTSISNRKNLSRDELEVLNVKFHRWYSYIVGLLIVIQILLALKDELLKMWSSYFQ